ncbi:NUDIX hydrolase [Actinopolymorpha singaporensis]
MVWRWAQGNYDSESGWGGLRQGEASEDAVLRELAEETGLAGDVRRLVGVHSNVYRSAEGSVHGVRLIYLMTTSAVVARGGTELDAARSARSPS